MALGPQKGYLCTLTVDDGAPKTVAKARDVKLTADGKEIDVSSRSGAGWKEFLQGLKEWALSVDQVWVADDTGLAALQAAFLSGDVLAAELLDADGYGFSGDVIVTKFERGEPLEAGVMCPVELKGTGALAPVTP